jgi:hypothetical protein
VYVLETYPTALFVGSPIAASSLCAYVFNHRHPRSFRDTLTVAMLSLFMIAGTLALFALEGALCILMAMPLAFVVAVLGALVGRGIAIRTRHAVASSALVVAALPLSALLEEARTDAPVYEVVTTTVVDAPPARVWPHVVAVSELPPPARLFFALGVAYPMRARIEGEGVGAVRHCEFSTGAFVEPITVWDEPRRLAFDVVAQPPPMKEWSPYRDLHPPHLDGYFRTTRGEFRLVDLGDGRTRLEGRTWYELDIHPRGYWRFFADALVHRIHERVLEHVERTAE